MSFLSARMKELKKASTPNKLPPILGSLTENRRNRRLFLCFGKAGRRLKFFYFDYEEYCYSSRVCNKVGGVDEELSEAVAENRREYYLGKDAG